MKALHVINSLDPGGAEKLLLETIPLYNRKGIQADLLVLNGRTSPFLDDLKAKNCCTIYSLGTTSAYNPFHVVKMMPFLRKYDIAHVHLFPSQYWIVLAKVFSFSKIKLIVTEHSTSNPRVKNYFLSIIDRFMYRFYDKIVCITVEVYDIIFNHLQQPKSKFMVIQNGANLQKVYDALPYTKNAISGLFTEEDILLIQVASFNKHKDQQTVIKALQFLPKNVKLVFAGDGILKSNCETLVQELGLNNRVLFLGTRMDIPQLLKTADISILSTNGEGLSLAAIEGMASGKPFIASNVPGITNLVEGAGILFEKGNAEELAACIMKLVNEKVFYEETVKTCLMRAKPFDIEFMADKHVLLYKEILNS